MEKTIWFNKELSLDTLPMYDQDTLPANLGLEWVEVGPDFLKMKMPVDGRTRQPYGILHGGASCALAETVGSLGSAFIIDPMKQICVGLDINANHLKAVRAGFVTGTARPIHLGKSTHVWEIKITNESEELVCISRLTMAILDRRE